MVMVYQFEGWSQSQGDMITAAKKATAEFITANNLTLIAGTGEEVPDNAVDGNGRYNPDA